MIHSGHHVSGILQQLIVDPIDSAVYRCSASAAAYYRVHAMKIYPVLIEEFKYHLLPEIQLIVGARKFRELRRIMKDVLFVKLLFILEICEFC